MVAGRNLDSGWQFPRSVTRVEVVTRGDDGRRLLDEATVALERAHDVAVCPVESGVRSDLRLVVGAAEWAEDFIRQSRAAGDPVPLVVITVTSEGDSTTRLLNAGADDCLPYPFDPSELLARVHAVIRRSEGPLQRCAEIAIDRANLRIRVRDVEARVSRRQLEIFTHLAEHRERWVHTDEIIAGACGTHHDPATSLVRVQIHALRKALGAAGGCIRCDGHKSYMLSLEATASTLTAK